MSKSVTITIRLDSETKSSLDFLAEATHRSRSFLAAEAVASYVKKEAAILSGIEAGLEDMKAGRVVPHDQAMMELERITGEKRKS